MFFAALGDLAEAAGPQPDALGRSGIDFIVILVFPANDTETLA